MNSCHGYIVLCKNKKELKRVKLVSTSGLDETLVIVLPHKKPFDRKLYGQEYYQRPEVIARRKTPEAKARKAAYDKLYGKRPGCNERKRELRRRNKELVNKRAKSGSYRE